MKTNVAILGYGNLGKALEELILLESNICLVGIFSRRNNVSSKFNTPVYKRKQLLQFKGKIDLLILCGGSQNDIINDAQYYSKHFNTINTFDTHELIPKLFNKLNNIAKQSNHVAILSAGWDPGLFSVTKVTFSSILNKPCTCFWGKGVSMGHSQAVKNLEHVTDAISITIPNKNAKNSLLKNQQIKAPLHSRKVYVVSKHNSLNKNIKNKIVNMPHYFKNQKVSVRFVSAEKLNKLKTLNHMGEVICTTPNNLLYLKIKMNNNAMLTAKIILSYTRVIKTLIKKYDSGAYTPLHFSPLDLSTLSEIETIKKFC